MIVTTRQVLASLLSLVLAVSMAGNRKALAAPRDSERPPIISKSEKALDDLRGFSGKTIRQITIEVHEIFDDPDLEALYRAANGVKVNTRKGVVERELLYKSGDKFDPFLIRESERILRALRYLRDIKTTAVADGDYVDLTVSVQDTWTFIPQAGYSSGTGSARRSIGLAETNLGGMGKRAEILYREDEVRNSLEAVWEDPRVWGSDFRFLGAYFDRSDGERSVLSVGKPIRSLVDREAWIVSLDNSNSIGRLFENGDENYIYRHKLAEITSRFTVARGNPELDLRRYSLGYDYLEHRFSQAETDDYGKVNLDPRVVGNDPARLAANRRFTGPAFTFEHLTPHYVSKNYIDRFERVEDYDLGPNYSLNLLFASKIVGSSDDALLASGSRAFSYQFDEDSFVRNEIGLASRYSSGGFADTIARFESKYYDVLGSQYLGNLFIGRHTLAASFFVDYGYNLDGDRQFLLGGDNVVRGYSARSFSGDKRYGFNVEDRVHFVDDLYHLVSVGGAAFFDAGGASYGSLGSLFADHTYSDVGVGLRLAFPRSTNGSLVRVDLAFPLRDGPDGSGSFEVRMIFAAGQLFDSHLRSENLGAEKANVAIGLDR